MIFFFSSRRRHTRWPRDWSSDVCSSDLVEYSLLIGLPKFHHGIRNRVAITVDGGHRNFHSVFTIGDDLCPLADEANVNIRTDGLRWHDAEFGLILIANNWFTVTELTVRRFINTHFLLLFKSRPAYSNGVEFLPR